VPFGLRPEEVTAIRAVFARYPSVEEVLIYGSRAKGNFRPGSDVDLTLKGVDIDLQVLNRISNDLDDLLLPYTFDLSVFHHIDNPHLTDHIKRVGTVFYSRD